jgi:signal transduction histidine kinase/DNA-binding response OmpR family regulator
MVKKTEHLTQRVLLGYASMLALAIVAIIHISGLITRIMREEAKDDSSGEKTALITSILLLLYESETYAQFADAEDEEFAHFNRTLDRVHEQLQRLKSCATDSAGREKIGSLELLLKQKRENTLLLQYTRGEMEHLYAKHIGEGLKTKRGAVRELERQMRQTTKKDTLFLKRQHKGFFKRLAEAFVPVKADSAIYTNSASLLHTDSLVNEYDPSGVIARALKQIQSGIDAEYGVLQRELTKRVDELRGNSYVIAAQIKQLLSEIEQEEMQTAQNRELARRDIVRNSSGHLALVAAASICITFLFLFLILRDISKSRYYRTQLEEANRLAQDLLKSREKFMLMISHDIRAPLSSILGYIELLRQPHPGDDREAYFRHISTLSGHILALLNDLLDFHRLESGRMTVRPVPFGAAELCDEICAGFRPPAEAKGLTLRQDIQWPDPQNPPVLLGDPVRIRQAAGNLLSNAIKFTPEGAVTFTVRAEATDPRTYTLCISVKDEGPGIAEAEQETIFKEFARLEGAEKAEGFGLGLSIACKLIDLMGGSLALHSKPGEGSEFVIRLPLPLSDASLPAEPAAKEPPVCPKPLHCLVIDDDILQRKLTEELLKRHHIRVTGLSDPEAVAPLLETASFDVILTDIQMPVLDGYALLARIRTSGAPGAETLPVVALSATLPEEQVHYVEAGFTAFLRKPFTAADLVSLLNGLFPAPPHEAGAPPNIAALTAFAGDDDEAARAILQTFTEETARSLALLHEALEHGNRPQASGVSHKLIPTLSMLGAHPAVQQLRKLETGGATLSETEWRQTLREAIALVTDTVRQIKQM